MLFRTLHVLALAGLLASPVFAQDAPTPAPASSMEELLAPLTKQRAYRETTAALQVVNVRTGEEVFARDADRGLMPASTMKVVTTAAALKNLGPSYRFTTDVYTDGVVDASGTLRGNLYVQGHGDPTLVVEKLWKLVYDLKLDGVKRVAGDIVFDDTFFDDPPVLPGWGKKEDIEGGPSYYPNLSALSLNFNTVALVIGPGGKVGEAGRVELETPAADYVVIENKVLTGKEGTWRRVEVERIVEPGHTRFVVTGSVPAETGTRKLYRTVEHFAAAFGDMMDQVGVAHDGKRRVGKTPDNARLLHELRSPPLAAILMDMNKYSNNFMAEQVLRTLGAEHSEGAGSTETGLEAIREYLDGLGVPRDSYTLVNGSGLSRSIRMPPSVLTAVMLDMAHDERVGHEFRSSLAIAGRDGTLWKRLRDEPDRMRGKTGTVDGVHCLTGYVEGGDGELYAFAFLGNDLRGGSAPTKQLHDSIARALLDTEPAGGAVVEGEGKSGAP